MLFNIHYGQKRVGTIPGKGRAMVFRPTSPRKMILMQNYSSGIKGPKQLYRADALGNIDVTHPAHVQVMVGLGHPIYIGNGKLPVEPEDLLWPTLEPDSQYWKAVSQAVGKEMHL
jgi:hypothetical protein